MVLFLIGLLAVCIGWPLPESAQHHQGVVSTRLYDRQGLLIDEYRPAGSGIPIRLTEVPPFTIQALISAEDRYFYRHPGVNPLAIGRALYSNLLNKEVVSGASTLTMQVARSLLGSGNRSIFRKIRESLLAVRLEVYLSKEEILQLWLNRAYFGNQVYGIEAASRLYFAKPARDLTRGEVAFLIGLPQRPGAYNPFRFPDIARDRQQRILQSMNRVGFLSDEDTNHLMHLPIDLAPPERRFNAPHLTNRLRSWLDAHPEPISEVHTTLDIRLQQAIESVTRTHLDRLDAQHVSQAAVLVTDNLTGEILAWVGSADYWDEARQGQNDGVLMLRQPGSTLKPFLYGLALSGPSYTAASILPDIELQIPEAGGAFSPQNYDKRFHGPVPLRQALASSYNVPAVRLAREMGPDRLLGALHEVGFHSLNRPAEHYGVGLSLGNGEVRLLELNRAYTSLAHPYHPPPHLSALRYVLAAGQDTLQLPDTLYPFISPVYPVKEPAIAQLLTDILKDPEARSPAFGRHGPLELPFDVAVKTGTSKDYRDNWAIGYSPAYTVSVWVGNFDGSAMKKVSGVSGAGPLFHSIMMLLGDQGTFPDPTGLTTASICPLSGLVPGPHCGFSKAELFLPESAPHDTCTVHQRVAINSVTGALANAHTPAKHVRYTTLPVYPAMYHNWMRENRMPVPPEPAPSIASQPADSQLRIDFPGDGARFFIDPVLRTEFQSLMPRATIPTGYEMIGWFLDETPLATDGPARGIVLEPGVHQLELRVRNTVTNQIHRRVHVYHVYDASSIHENPLVTGATP